MTMIGLHCVSRLAAVGGVITGNQMSRAMFTSGVRDVSGLIPTQIGKVGRIVGLRLNLVPFRGHERTHCQKCVTARRVGGQDYRVGAEEDLPRFRVDELAPVGSTIFLDGANFKHAARSLRLRVGDRVELCDGRGRVASASILSSDKSSLSAQVLRVSTVAAQQQAGAGRWHVAVACASLKGGRSDWLVEKCAELGAVSLRPVLTSRSPLVSEHGRAERWARVAEAASKQSLRVFDLELLPPTTLQGLIAEVRRQGQPILLATPDGIPFLEAYQQLYGGTAAPTQRSAAPAQAVPGDGADGEPAGSREALPASTAPAVIPASGFLLIGPEGGTYHSAQVKACQVIVGQKGTQHPSGHDSQWHFGGWAVH
eukprot:jgi/Mesvir1/28618/Mv01029-RA.4